MNTKNKLIFITGPTATGKTELAVQIAKKFAGEIISADSRQVYKKLDIGTGKDLKSYQNIPYHLIDIIDAMEEYDLYHFHKHAHCAIKTIFQKKALPIICGGTPLYINSLLNGYLLPGNIRDKTQRESYKHLSIQELKTLLKTQFPEQFKITDITQKERLLRALEIAKSAIESPSTQENLLEQSLILAPYYPRKIVHERIRMRLQQRWNPMICEVRNLLKNGVTHKRLDQLGLEYRYMSQLLKNELTEKEAFEKLFIKIRQFCKRQDIWFRKMENEGIIIHWIKEGNADQTQNLIELFLNHKKLPEPEIKISEIHYGPKSQ